MSYKDNEITIINNYINILDKKWRLKRTLLIQYEINNCGIVFNTKDIKYTSTTFLNFYF